MRIFSKLTFFALAALIMGSCQKPVNEIGTPDPQPVLPDPIAATLQGNVLDENGAAASGVTVSVGNRTVTTDNRGFFRITGASLDKNMSLVKAEKTGYFKAYRSFAATSGANQVQIKMIRRSLAGTVSGTAGGEAALANGSKVALPANGVVTASSGADYTGSVKVYAAYIDPTASDIGQVVPGSLLANDVNDQRVLLTSYGMLAVELEGAAGEKLQIRSGANATLTTAIPAAALASAPATIPMWYLDETSGVWKQQGSATKQGSAYVGTVSHFSFWNCDAASQMITLTVTLNNSNGSPLPHTLVRITRSNQYNTNAYGYTDSLGVVRGAVPANEALILSVLDYCGNVLFTQNIGPYAQNTNLAPITATVPATQMTTVTGKLLDCNNAAVTSGYAIIAQGNLVRYAGVDANGNFSSVFLTCSGSNNLEIIGVNNTAQIQSGINSVSFTAGTTAAGNITVCGTSSLQFINYSVDGSPFALNSTNNDSLTMYSSQVLGTTTYRTSISGSTGTSSSSTNISLSFQGAPAPGTYPATGVYVNNVQTTSSAVNVTVTGWPAAIGDFMQATFTGSYVASGVTHTLSGSFKLRKTF